MNNIEKVLILTDSAGAPRAFPPTEVVELEETYPYLLRKEFKDAVFYQLSVGNIVTEQLIAQAISYLPHWDPDIVIVHSGMNDCRPEPFTDFQKMLLNKMSGPLTGKLKRFLYNPKRIKRCQVYRVRPQSFKKTIKKLKTIFSHSKIFWLEICAGRGYEDVRPGVNKRMEEYNKIIESIYGEEMVHIQQKMLEVDGFNVDNLHWRKAGHKVVANLLIEKINALRVETEGIHT